jgi:hypothetical protein
LGLEAPDFFLNRGAVGDAGGPRAVWQTSDEGLKSFEALDV